MEETLVVTGLRTNLTDTWRNSGNARRRQGPACVYRLEVVLRNTGVGWEMFMSVATPRAACVPGAVCRSTAPACNTRTNKQAWGALRRSVSPDTPLNRSAMDRPMTSQEGSKEEAAVLNSSRHVTGATCMCAGIARVCLCADRISRVSPCTPADTCSLPKSPLNGLSSVS